MSRTILKQSSTISFFSLLSRIIAFFREILLIRFLSVGAYSDIFFTAVRIPNTLRKILAEGSLSSILVPAFVTTQHKHGTNGLNRLVSLSFIVIETTMFLACCILFIYAKTILHFIVPGFSPEKIEASAQLLQILVSFVLFISSGSIFAAALQAERKFVIPALAPAILNICYVASLSICLYAKLSITVFCYFWIATAVIFFLLHLVAYIKSGAGFAYPNNETKKEIKQILMQLLPCFFIVGISEINHFINTGFCSYLADGSMTLLRYTYQFVNIPIGLITTPLVTVLLPYFSKLHLQDPKILASQLFETLKFIIWMTMPTCLFMMLYSEQIFHTLFWNDTQAIAQIPITQLTFIAYLLGLIFFSFNKIFSCVFYAQRSTLILLLATIVSITINYFLNSMLFESYGIAGIAFSSSIAAIAQTIIFIYVLHKKLGIGIFAKEAIQFLARSCLQLIVYLTIIINISGLTQKYCISKILNTQIFGFCLTEELMLHGFGFWAWQGPLILLFYYLLYKTRSNFGIKLNYLDTH